VPKNVSKADKTVRCIALLVALARAKRGIQLRPFFERRGWCWRSAYRDLETLRRAGVPIEQHERGWFRVAEGWIPPGAIDVKRDELAALLVARRLSPGLRELDALWGKLSGPRQLALDLDGWLDMRPPSIDYGAHRLAFEAVQQAIRDRRVLRLEYRSATSAKSRRFIEPAVVRWEPSVEAFYVVAWCRMRAAIRTFAIHRIISVEPIAEKFTPRREALDEMRKAFRLWTRPHVQHVSLRFTPSVACEVRERRWHASEVISETADGGVRVEMDIAAPEELERLLLGFGPHVTVEAPTTLATRILELHASCVDVARARLRRIAPQQTVAFSVMKSSPQRG
jgi:predicted DNA-binding transcriptional regulator YafY